MKEADFTDKEKDACLTCFTAVQTGLGMEWSDALRKYEDGTDLEFNEDFDQTIANVERIQDGCDPPQCFPGSSVETTMQFGEYSYVELLFLSEAQVLKHCGATARALNLAVEEREREDASGTIKGVQHVCNGEEQGAGEQAGAVQELTVSRLVLVTSC